MSDYLDGLGVANIDPLDNADPQDSEAASSLAAAIRQIKSIEVALWRVAHNDDGTLKAGAATVSTLPDDSVNGSSSNASTATAGKIQTGTVSTNDLRDLAVSAGKLAVDAVTTAKILDANVTAAKLATDAVSTVKIVALAVTAAKLAADAVETAKIANLAVTAAKIATGTITGTQVADNSIGTDKLSGTPTAGQVLLGYGSAPKYRPTTITGAISIDSAGVASLTGSVAVGNAVIREVAGAGTSGGGSTATVDLTVIATTGIRGSSVAWSISGSLAAQITDSSGTLTIAQAGTYLFHCSAPAFGVGSHRIGIQLLDSGLTTIVASALGTAEYAAPGQQTRSETWFIATVTAGQKLRLRHYCQNAVATNGFGLATSATGSPSEVYATINVLKI